MSLLRAPAAVAIAVFTGLPLFAQDRVHVAGSTGGKRVMVGRVVDYTGEGLVFEHPGGRRENVPAERVLAVETTRVGTHNDADAAFDQRRFDAALALYERAVNEERRIWVRRDILAQMVRCYRATGRIDLAANSFLALLQSDPATRHFDAIPLGWVAEQPSPALEQTARSLLAREEPAAGLIGASYLLSTSGRNEALARLRQLAANTDRRIALLATAQSWRAGVATADVGQVESWQQTIGEMPEPLTAGPYFVLGQARLRLGQSEQAALALMRAPVLYPGDRRLAAAALLSAGRALEQLGRRQKAARLYREVIQSYPEQDQAVAGARHLLEKAFEARPAKRKLPAEQIEDLRTGR